jgi:hypothetical protein
VVGLALCLSLRLTTLLALNAFCSCHKALGISEPRALIRIRESAVIFPPITAMTRDHGLNACFSLVTLLLLPALQN